MKVRNIILKILHIVNDANTGGAQTLIESLATETEPPDETHVLVLMGEGVLSRRLESVATSVSYIGISRRTKNPLRPVRKLREIVRRRGIDLVHSHLLQSDLVALISNLHIPVVSTLHTSGSHESGTASKIVSYLVARLSRQFDEVIACSESAQNYAIKMRYASSDRVSIIPNGSKIPEFSDLSVMPQKFVSLSRWHPMKDHRTLFAAFQLMLESNPRWRLICAGNDINSGNSELMDLVSEFGIGSNTDLLGPIEDVDTLLRGAAALVISSSHGEALPMAGIEALARAVPVITTDVGDCGSLTVNARTLTRPRSVEDLASAMIFICSASSEEYAEIRRKSWDLARASFSAADTAKLYRSVYESKIRPKENAFK